MEKKRNSKGLEILIQVPAIMACMRENWLMNVFVGAVIDVEALGGGSGSSTE